MRVFLGSTYLDLKDHREAALEVLGQFAHSIEAMEFWEAAPAEPLSHCLDRVRECDVYICLVAFRYGSVSDDGCSFTHREYLLARELGKDVLIFLMSKKHSVSVETVDTGSGRKRVDAFRRELRKNHMCSSFHSLQDLAQKVATSLRCYLLDRRIVTPANIESSWKEMSQAWLSGVPDDMRVEFDPNKEVADLLDEAAKVANGLESLVSHVQKSHDSLEADLEELLTRVGLEVERLRTVRYYENPFINRDWDYIHVGFPNWLTQLRLLLAQIRVRHLEGIAQTNMWDERRNSDLLQARETLTHLLETSGLD